MLTRRSEKLLLCAIFIFTAIENISALPPHSRPVHDFDEADLSEAQVAAINIPVGSEAGAKYDPSLEIANLDDVEIVLVGDNGKSIDYGDYSYGTPIDLTVGEIRGILAELPDAINLPEGALKEYVGQLNKLLETKYHDIELYPESYDRDEDYTYDYDLHWGDDTVTTEQPATTIRTPYEVPSVWGWIKRTANKVKTKATDTWEDVKVKTVEFGHHVKKEVKNAGTKLINFHRAFQAQLPQVRQEVDRLLQRASRHMKRSFGDVSDAFSTGYKATLRGIARGADQLAESSLMEKIQTKLQEGDKRLTKFFVKVGDKIRQHIDEGEEEFYDYGEPLPTPLPDHEEMMQQVLSPEQQQFMRDYHLNSAMQKTAQDKSVQKQLRYLVKKDVLTEKEASLLFAFPPHMLAPSNEDRTNNI